jgi:hypothetical protein
VMELMLYIGIIFYFSHLDIGKLRGFLGQEQRFIRQGPF